MGGSNKLQPVPLTLIPGKEMEQILLEVISKHIKEKKIQAGWSG